MRRWIPPMLGAVAAFVAMPAARAAYSPDTFLLIAEEENIGTAATATKSPSPSTKDPGSTPRRSRCP